MNSVYQTRVLQLAGEVIAKLNAVHGWGTSETLIDVSELEDLLGRVRSVAGLPGVEVPPAVFLALRCFDGTRLDLEALCSEIHHRHDPTLLLEAELDRVDEVSDPSRPLSGGSHAFADSEDEVSCTSHW
jgi:hypothetical protein